MQKIVDKLLIKTLCLMALSVVTLPSIARGADAGDNYCVTPPFITSSIKPNLLLLIDNSSSMYDLGYIAGSTSAAPSYSCGSAVVSSAYCFDNTYDNTEHYEGYFSKYNAADNSTSYPVYQYSAGKFVELASGIPATTGAGIYRTEYLHVTMSGSSSDTPSTRAVSSFIASGRFLNWLSASKFDIEKKILTGGKYDTASGTLVGESRGCVGRRFVKVIPDLPALSFAVRGPTAVEPVYDPKTQGGETVIEIFEGDYNENACQCAVYNWTNGNYGQAATDTKSCLGTSPSDKALATLNHTQQTCWLLKDNYYNKGLNTAATIWQGINTQDIETACANVYTDSKNPVLPSEITNESSGNYICTSAKPHGTPVAPYNLGGSDTTGFVGSCWQGGSEKFQNRNDCVKREILHYCMGVNFTEVTDPTTSAASSGNIPAVIMDAGVRAIGEPVGSFPAKVQASVPTGLIQQFANDIRFGAMRFNDAGSKTECGAGTAIPCTDASNQDGGKMMPNSYIGSPLGDHGTGLIKDIGDIEAKTWTPFAEAFYNAIAYFVKDATDTTPSLNAAKFTPRTTAPLPIKEPLSDSDSYENVNPIQFRCQQNNILFISDGTSTADQNSVMKSKVTESSNVFRDPNTIAETGSASGVCGTFSGSPYLHDLSYYAYHRNIFNPAQVCRPAGSELCETAQTIKTHVVYSAPVTANPTNVCDSYTQMSLTATNGGTTVRTPAKPSALRSELKAALESIAAGASSGTAASILSNSEGSGANILQAVFYPEKVFESQTSVDWIGEMQNLWYFVDPQISRSTIREDSGPTPDKALNLVEDKVVSFRFNTADNITYAYLSDDSNGDGLGDTPEVKKDSDDVESLWRAGKKLHERNLQDNPRVIYTPHISGGTQVAGTGLMRFSYGANSLPDHTNLLKPYLQESDTEKAKDIMKYVHGFDFPDNASMRNRTVKKGSVPAGAVGSETYKADAATGRGVWKLGDIISSTPRIQSISKLNNYNLPAPSGYSDSSYSSFIASSDYKNRGMVYVGANDGMLHAFKLGLLSVSASSFQKATLSKDADLGEEKWAFIPKNALPYLNYYPSSNYNHLYYIDGSTVLFDASIGERAGEGGCEASNYWECTKLNSVVDGDNALVPANNTWRTLLIGGMGLGGASSKSCASGANCVQTPVADPANASLGLGYSSYFALDVSNPDSPKLLWEFNDPALGYATTGPAIIRVGERGKNGRWFAVFGSGPTGPIDTTNNQFMGRSNQNLKFFVVDLRTGLLERTIDTGITEAFAGSMLGAAIDADRWNQQGTGNYVDDALYVGYTQKVSGTPDTWTGGGVGRISTKESTDVSTWAWSPVIQDTGPVITAVSRLQDRKNKKLWLYFGTGRYYHRSGTSVDDFSTRRAIFGIKEPCYNTAARPGNYLDKNCTAAVTAGITNQSDTISTDVGAGGWRVDLDSATTDNGAERVVTDAVALTNGTVFLTSFAPTADACGFGGNSYLWALDYDTGGRPDDAALAGKALIQLSTGEFKQVDLGSAFGSGSARLRRRTSVPMTGKPPADAFPIVSKSNNKPVKRIMHIQER